MEFSWKKNLTKAAISALVAAASAGFVVAADALERGEVDMRKVAVGVSAAFSAALFKSMRNYLKNHL